MWAFMAALGVSRHTGIVSSSYAVYRQHSAKELQDEYLDALLRTKPYKAEYICRSTGIRESRLRLYPDQLLRIPILCPPREEQQRIVDRINEEGAEIRSAIATAEREIELMNEFRASLIAEAVTGKIDVRSKP
jgi:type I restriction enzyme S subunit